MGTRAMPSAEGSQREGAAPAPSIAGPCVVAEMPSGLPDASRLVYVLETLLNPLGLGVECQPAAVAVDGVRLAWRDRPVAGGVDVDLPRLRQAFEAISGQREFAVPRDRLGRVRASALGVDCSRPVWSEWAREWATALAARKRTGKRRN